MSIKEELEAELKDAIKSGDRRRRDVIREIETQLSRARAEPGFSGSVDDELCRSTIASFSKKMDKAAREYEALGERGQAMADKLNWEVTYLSRWLPATPSEEATRSLVRAAIEDLGVDDPKMAGRVVGYVIKNSPEQLEGALVNRLVREELEET